MRRQVVITAIAATLAAGCGGESSDEAVDQARTQAETAVESGREAAEQLRPEAAVRETEQLIEDVTRSARRLAEDPQVDVDAELAVAEQRARELSRRARDELGTDHAPLAAALSEANEGLARAASELQDAASEEDVRRVISQRLDLTAEALRRASGQISDVPEDLRTRLDRARDDLEQLRDQQIPGLGG